jgi:hypothetical protein
MDRVIVAGITVFGRVLAHRAKGVAVAQGNAAQRGDSKILLMVQFSKWIDVPIIRIGHNGVNSQCYQRYYMNKKDIMDGQPPTLHLPGLMTFRGCR